MLTLALALLAVQQGPAAARQMLVLVPVSWLLGGLLGLGLPESGDLNLLASLGFTVSGLLVAVAGALSLLQGSTNGAS